jgi:tRNA-modifying protein YgfZ
MYDAARTGAAVAMRDDRSFIRVHGRDPVKMIQGLVSNDVAGAPAHRAVYAAVLTPKGKMVADVRVLRDGADLIIDVDAAAREPLVAHLRKFIPPLFARFETADEHWAALTVCGPDARSCIERAFALALPESFDEDHVTVATDGAMTTAFIIATAQFGEPGYDIAVRRDTLHDTQQRIVAAGAQPIDNATLDVLRVEAGRPAWGSELDENTIPLEAGLRERAISETKGCYTGQEVIVRILHRGHVNWLLRGVRMGDAPAPARGTALLSPGEHRRIGRITSAVWSPQHDQTIALAYVRREIVPDTLVHLESGDGPLVQVVDLAPHTVDS